MARCVAARRRSASVACSRPCACVQAWVLDGTRLPRSLRAHRPGHRRPPVISSYHRQGQYHPETASGHLRFANVRGFQSRLTGRRQLAVRFVRIPAGWLRRASSAAGCADLGNQEVLYGVEAGLGHCHPILHLPHRRGLPRRS